MINFLDIVKESTRKRVKETSIEFTNEINTLNFCNVFSNSEPNIIAEIKFASPSQGLIYSGVCDPLSIAEAYIHNGAPAISVLTEPDYFKGNIEHIKTIRTKFPAIPILMKDFILDEKQISQGLQYGANAILLIVAFLTPKRLDELYHYATSLDLTVIIEVHNQAELDQALTLNPKVIGINNRNLESLQIDLSISRALVHSIPESILTICESGIDSSLLLKEFSSLGFDGFLIGSHFMKHIYPGQALKRLRLGSHYAC